MKRFFILFFLSLFVISLLSQSYDNAGADYTKAFMIKDKAQRIKAFETYIKKYPDPTKNSFLKLAYYWLAADYSITKNFGKAVTYANKALKFNDLPKDIKAKTYYVLAVSYGHVNSPVKDNNKALNYANKAISLAKVVKLKDLLVEAEKIKKKVSGPPPKTPEQKLKSMYVEEDYLGFISYYKQVPHNLQVKTDIHELYAKSLYKLNKLDKALKEYNNLLESNKKPIYFTKIGEIYAKKAAKNKLFYDKAITNFIKASILYKKQNDNSKSSIALKNAKYNIFKKYGYFAKIKKYNASLQRAQAKAKQNQRAISKLKREIRRYKRRLRKEYYRDNLEPPAYELEGLEKLEKKLKALQSGMTSQQSDEGEKLKKEKTKIEKEFNSIYDKIKSEMM